MRVSLDNMRAAECCARKLQKTQGSPPFVFYRAPPKAAPEKNFQKNLVNTSPKFEKFCQIFYIFRRILSKI